MIKLALNQSSCENSTIEQFIKISKDFYGLELNFKETKRIIPKDYSFKQIKELINSYNLRICSLFNLEEFSLNPDNLFKSKTLKYLNKMVYYCDKLECDLIIAHPSNINKESSLSELIKTKIINRTRKRLESISKHLDNDDIHIGFEFLVDSSVSSLEEAIEMIEPLKYRENLGLIIDIFHLALSQSDYKQIKQIKDLIYMLQLSDLKYDEQFPGDHESNKNKLKRLFPGQGNYNFKEFFHFIHKMHYNKIYSLELNKYNCKNDLYKQFSRFFQRF